MPSSGDNTEPGRKGRLHEEKSARQPSDLSARSAEIPEYVGDAAVDIIAVHGLASKYETTWCAELKDGSRYSWLHNKLGVDVPDARILGFEYGSGWYGDPSYTNLDECGTELLRCIIRDRRHVGRPEMCPTRRRRPIIFVAHSFGGLVVKQALVNAYRAWKKVDRNTAVEPGRKAEVANYRDFLCSVSGIIFLATPHRGSAFKIWANIKMMIGSMMGEQTHEELVKVLAVNSEPLAEVQRGFHELFNDSSVMDQSILPRCYRETRALKLPPYMVVSADSAFLDQAENGTMDANHMEMNKFLPGPDANYDKLLSDIQQMVPLASRSVSRRLEKWRYGSLIADDDRNMMEHRLDPSRTPQIRHLQLKLDSHRNAPYTCHWLDEQVLFKDWKSDVLDGKRNVLWIHGKPATGKSVLAAYVVETLQGKDGAGATSEEKAGMVYSPCDTPLGSHECGSKVIKPTVLYYFCGVDRSHDRPEGILGTLIHQLLSIHDTDETLFSTAHRWKESTQAANINAKTLTTLLQELICLVSGQVFIIVDALDETPHGSQCLDHLNAIALKTQQTIRLLITSQRQEALRTRLEGKDSVAHLSITDFSQSDISQYIRQKTDQLLVQRPSLGPKHEAIVQRLQNDVEGIFEVVNTTVHHLETHLSSVDDVDDYLDNLPSSMEDVYDKIFERLRPSSKVAMTRVRTALQFLAVSATPITVVDLQVAIKASRWMKDTAKETALQTLWTAKPSKEQSVEARQEIIQLLDTLVKVDENNFVTLVHSSLLHSLISDQNLFGQEETSPYMPNHSWYQFSESQAHRLVSDICIVACSNTTLIQANAFATQPPLLAYSWNYWAYHLRASHFTLDSYTPQSVRSRNAFDTMLRRAHQSTLSFLGALGVFLTRPLDPVSGNYSILEYRQSLQRAQHSTTLAIWALCNSRQSFPIAAKLHKERDRIPADLDDIPADSKYQSAVRWGRSKASRFRGWLFKDETQVTQVKVDTLMETSAIPNLYGNNSFPEPVEPLLESSRALRQVALTFAVNPIHSALMQRADLGGFSPIHFLVYVAQLLEEAASFPYWEHLHEVLDPADAFICPSSDPQADAAKFVLRSVDWQRPNKRLVAEMETVLNPKEGDAASILALGRKLRQLTEVTPHRWVAARVGFDMFQTDPKADGAWFQALVANPMANLHLKEKLYMLDKSDDRNWPVFLSPTITLDLNAPTSLRDAPVKEVITAMPSILMFIYAKYVASLLELFAEVPRSGVVAHFIQLTTSRTELLDFAQYVKTLWGSSMKRLRHVPLALLLYYLRLQFFPFLGAHAMSHPFRDLLLSYHHPAAYLNLQSFHDAWFWFKYAMGIRLWNAAGRTFVVFTQVEGLRKLSEVQLVSDTLAGFYQIVTLERNVFGLGFSLAVLTASAKIIMYDRDNLGAVGEFTLWYVVINGFGVFNIVVGAFLQQTQASFLQGLAVVGPEFVVLGLLFVYQEQALLVVGTVLGWVVWPIVGPAMFAWRMGLYLYAPIFNVLGVVVFVLFVLAAAVFMEKAIWDPHDLEGSKKKVINALREIEGMRDKVEKLDVGDLKHRFGVLEEESNSEPVESTGQAQGGDEDDGGLGAWGIGGGDVAEQEETEGSGDESGAFGPQVEAQLAVNTDNPEVVVGLSYEEALEIFSQAAVKEFESVLSHFLQSVQHVRFDSFGGWGSGGRSRQTRDFGMFDGTGYGNDGGSIRSNGRYGGNALFANDRYDRNAHLRQRGNGWRIGGLTPGVPFGQISYHSSRSYGSAREMWESESMFVMTFILSFVAVLGWMLWALWEWWRSPTSGIVVGGAEVQPQKSCWEVGPVSMPPVYFGWSSCDGWSWGFDFGLLLG